MKKHFSIQTKIVSILVLFIVGVLLLIAFFQTIFLDDFYSKSKVKHMKSVSENIIYHLGNDDLEEAMSEASISNEVCVRAVSLNGLSFTTFNQNNVCALNYVNEAQMMEMVQKTIEEDGEYLFENYRLALAPYDVKDLYIYTKIVELNRLPICIMVSSVVEPLNATVDTVRSQYFFIVIVVMIATVLMGVAISKRIIRPIYQLKEEAKNLPKGKYDAEVVKDCSLEIQELNETLKEANIEIHKSDKTRKELLSNVSHDLRTPLTMIVGYGEMIRDLKEEYTEENMNVIIDEAKRLSALVDDLLDISNLEQHNLVLNIENHSLNECLKKVYHQYEKFFSDIEFILELDEDVMCFFDEKRIMQVLYNFLNNAYHYNDAKDKKVILKSERFKDYVRVSVYDNGSGIDEKDLDKVFDRYYKVDKEHRRTRFGSGIGLAICKELLEAHHFKYGVESKRSEYSIFYFDIPF